ncbi:ferrous iron transport protein B [Candidatus Venteria ishoeyi]|nr:ferrous iron transport protein B [Candidatus Venteria ishoeyi]MDM8547935.1 ferrous iron transport protein B [Candidatus Venteria ishoeyi]
MNTIRIALVGQPNVGKSMLINAMGNTRLKVGNFSGVTVSKKLVKLSHRDYALEITDLPGSYALNEYTREEKVTRDFLATDNYDLILNVVDSTNIERNLYLTTELLSLNKKMLLALNMDDEAITEEIHIDAQQLSKLLGKRCIKTSAAKKTGINALLDAIVEIFEQENSQAKLQFSEVIEEEISHIVQFFQEKHFDAPMPYRESAILLLKEDPVIFKVFRDTPVWVELQPLLNRAFEHIYLHYQSKDLDDIFNEEEVAFAKGLVTEAVQFQVQRKTTLTEKIDSILIHKFAGLPIFLFLMWALFQLTFELGSVPMDWIDAFFASLIDATKNTLGDTELASVIGDGAIAGVGAVVLFLPNIIILFLGIALLETTGYMSRVAFLLDGFFHKFGLHGKSFIPLVSGFGCSVPAYMAARTLKNERDRLLTLFIIGFMSCGARLPVYVLFVGAFFAAEYAGSVLFVIYISGALFGIMAAKILKMTVFKGEDEPFVMEMPKYRLPSIKLIWHTVSNQAWMYLKKAGSFILLASVLIWFASNYPKQPEQDSLYQAKIEQAATLPNAEESIHKLNNERALYHLEHSYLGQIGKFSQPFFAPLGYDWKMSVALETGLAAKEVVVSTLGILYGLGEETDESSEGLIEKIQKHIPFAAAVSFIVFVMIYLPCLAASMVFAKEAGGWKYLGYLFVFTTATAWVMAFISYHLTLLLV